MAKDTSEIVKLTERISKDPKSKLFVPLAEEYKKAGDLEMAIYVLTEGLKNNPGYVTARAILGRLLFDQGDLAGAQKELQEVIKVIPDNLLAQRKLGDICVLESKPKDALKHYQSVLALSPRDEEIVSLISEIEAGHDVSQKIRPVKSQAAPPKTTQPEKKSQPSPAPAQQAQLKKTPATPPLVAPAKVEEPVPAAPAQPVSVAAPVTPPSVAPAKVEEPVPAAPAQPVSVAAPVTPPPAAPAKVEQSVPAAPVQPIVTAAPSKIEEPEEIFLVEPLEKEKTAQEPQVSALDFLPEQDHGPATIPVKEDTEEFSFVSAGQPEKAVFPDELAFTDPNIFTKPLMEEAKTAVDEKPIEAEILELPEAPEKKAAPAAQPVVAAEESGEKADDFTTDTLAELYIAQGFYEKSIDIYERMLLDKPNSKGLKDKLDKVRAMAASAAVPVPDQGTPVVLSADIFSEPQVYSAKQEPVAAVKAAPFTGEPARELPAASVKERTPMPPDGTAGKATLPVHEAVQEKPAYTDFKPVEYTPPGTKPVEVKPLETKVEKAPATGAKSSTAIRKETIHRLESWLKNIKKET